MNDSKDPCEESELSSGSVQEWLSFVKDGKILEKENRSRRLDLSTKVRKHLSAVGWSFSYYQKGKKNVSLRYKSPNGKWFYSLASACVHENSRQQQQIVSKCDLSCSLSNLSLGSSESIEILPIPNVVKSNQKHEKKKKRTKDCVNEEKNRLSDLNQQQKKKKKYKKRKTVAAFNGSTPSEDKGKIRPMMLEKESLRFLRKHCGPDKNYDVCCDCHLGGELLLCDGCPIAFHHTCLGLSSLPEEELWFCPRCCCLVCGSMDSPENSMLMTCEQCQRRFHQNCFQEESCTVSRQRRFCSNQCSRVFSALQNLIGCKIAVGEGDLVWTLIRAPNGNEYYDDEQISKLDSAVEILHQGFEPTKDPISGKDLVEELISRKDKNGKSLGFYTVLIERKNQPITAAAMRVDKDVAEIPLVATLPNYRRNGMCRVLMNELEKQMSQMGVYRLVLPAATEVVTSWTQGFGFSVMESSERLELLKHGMLDFAGTVMCHKFLMEERKIQESRASRHKIRKSPRFF